MIYTANRLFKARFILLAGMIVFTAAVGTTTISATNASAASRDCHVFKSSRDWYEAGYVTSKEYTVPSSSECLDINVRNIKNNDSTISKDDEDKYCATFKVAMYPSDKTKPVYYSKPKRVCSEDPSSSTKTNGPVRVLATDVNNGTKYRVLYETKTPKKSISFQIVD